MKNLNYFPFERNRYYYGKLLTEQDFNQEQKYVNDKRRFINRFLFGTGVVAGLRVVAVGEKSISVEAGAALDYAGREILVNTPVNRNLSLIDGFEGASNGEKDYVYLCIEYDENQAGESFNITKPPVLEGERGDFDRIRESYHLYLTEEEPGGCSECPESLYRQEQVLLEWEQIRIVQRIPSAVRAGEPFDIAIEIQNLGPDRKVSLCLEEELTGITWGEERIFRMEEKELLLKRCGTKQQTFQLRAMALEQGEGRILLKPERLRLSVGNRSFQGRQETSFALPVLREDLWQAAKARTTEEAMELILKNHYPQGIYLARIYLIRTGDFYLIDRIVQNPFRQYVENRRQLAGQMEWLREEIKRLQVRPCSFGEKEANEKAGRDFGGYIEASGVVALNLGIGGKRGQRFFSEEIYHGLALGDVDIHLAVVEDDWIYSGSGEVFEDMKVKAELAVKVNMEKGSFVIGARLLEATAERSLKVRWRAVLSGRQKSEDGQDGPKLYIKPGSLQLRVRDSFYLETESEGMRNPSVRWEVVTREGGTITQDGFYTAPSIPGVYEIRAVSEENPDVAATLFVIVRE